MTWDGDVRVRDVGRPAMRARQQRAARHMTLAILIFVLSALTRLAGC